MSETITPITPIMQTHQPTPAGAPNRPMRIAVIGGGITGLSAAHRVAELACEHGAPIELKLIEAGLRLGGHIETFRQDGFLIERGPDAFITNKPGAINLCRRLDLTDRLISTNDENRRTFVVHRRRLHELPEGFQLLAPTRIWPLIASSLFTWPGKLRMAMELFVPPKTDVDDESLASFVTRRFGREAFERAAQPLIGGIYTADAETLSLRATMPRFLDMERNGSLLEAMLKQRFHAAGITADTGARYSMFVSFAEGMQVLVDALTKRLPGDATLLNRPVAKLQKTSPQDRWQIEFKDAPSIEADAVVLACPAHHTATLLRDVDAGLSDQIADINYSSSATVVLALRQEAFKTPPACFGFVVPHTENMHTLACAFNNIKFAGRAPDGCVLMRAFIGGALRPDDLFMTDDQMVTAVQRELSQLMGLTGQPIFSRVFRYHRAMPQYRVGHMDLAKKIRAQTAQYPGLTLAGNAYGGVGIPDCITSGQAAAEAAFTYLKNAGNAEQREKKGVGSRFHV